MSFTKRLIKCCLSVLLLFALAGFGRALYPVLRHFDYLSPGVLAFLGGGLLFVLLWFLYFSRKGFFWATLEHELTHAVFALLFLHPVQSLHASKHRGGSTTVKGGNLVIALAPYSFPLFSLLIVLLFPFTKTSAHVYFSAILGAAYSFYLLNLIREFHWWQPDILQAGRLFSFIFVLAGNLLSFTLILWALDGHRDFWPSLVSGGFTATIDLMKQLFRWLMIHIHLP